MSKLIDGTFPDYQRLIPQPGGARLVVHDTAALAWAIGQANFTGGQDARLRLTGIGQALRLELQGTTRSVVDVPAEVAAWEGGPIGFCAKPGYLADLCEAMPSGFLMEIRANDAPIRITGQDGLSLLMPIRWEA